MTSKSLTFEKARAEFSLTPDSVYLNSAAVGPLPGRTLKAMNAYYKLSSEAPWKTDTLMWDAFERVRELGATLTGASIENITYAYNTGFGLNIAAFGLPLEAGDEVVLTDINYPANVYPWLALEERGVKIRFAKSIDNKFSFDSLAESVTEKTKVIAVSFVQFHDGFKLPLSKISKLAESCGAYFVVDGIQGCGAEAINFHDLKIDILACGAQKWLLGPLGIGIVAISKRAREEMKTVARGWLSVDWPNYFNLFDFHRELFPDARRFSTGTAPAAHLVALEKSLELICELGVENIGEHTHKLLDKLISFVANDQRYRIVSSLNEDERSSIFCFTCSDSEKLSVFLSEEKIICARREDSIRISAHLFNSEDDIDRLIEALNKYNPETNDTQNAQSRFSGSIEIVS